jgi:hypothetical protein
VTPPQDDDEQAILLRISDLCAQLCNEKEKLANLLERSRKARDAAEAIIRKANEKL